MNVLIFGATGMIGQGVLRQAMAAEDVSRVVTVGRGKTSLLARIRPEHRIPRRHVAKPVREEIQEAAHDHRHLPA